MNHANLLAILEEVKSYFPHIEMHQPAISEKGIGWQVAHSLQVFEMVVQGLIESNPAKFQPSFRPLKYFVLFTGYIPRGKAKAPRITRPDESLIQVQELQNTLDRIHTLLPEIDKKTSENSYIEHPYFGHLHRKNVFRFLEVHTNHHVKIMKDIRNKSL